MDFQVITNNFVFLIGQGFFGVGAFTGGTLRLAIPAIVLGSILGTLVGLARLSPSRFLSGPAKAYVEFFRGVPLVMVIFWFWFIIPTLIGKSLPEYAVALTAFVIFEAAYLAEIVRAGIESLPKGQMEAARAVGLSYMQAMRKVILPQALYNMVPSMLSQFVSTIKETSLGYVISVNELTFAANQINSTLLSKPFQVFAILAGIYFILCFCLTQLARHLERRISRRRAGQAAGAPVPVLPIALATTE